MTEQQTLLKQHHHKQYKQHKQHKQDSKHGHFVFYKAEIIIIIIFVIINFIIALHQMMTQQIPKHPPPDSQMKQSYLSPILGRKRDAHDHQWQAFRSNILIMIFLMFSWKYTILLFFKQQKAYKIMRSFWLGLGILTFTYRADIFLFIGVILSWFYMTKLLYKSKIIIPLSWFIVIVTLYLNQRYDHFRFVSAWFQQFVPDFIPFFKNSQAPMLWTNILNMNFLKMLSFTMDCHWGYNPQNYRNHHQKCEQCKSGDLCYKGRDLYKTPKMTLKNYLDYIFFAPTCLAGPPTSFNNFFSFDQIPTKTKPQYLRMGLFLIYFQLFQHFYPTIRPDPSQSLIAMSFCSLMFLYFIYLKFSTIWRIGRLWALMYGVDTIQNMGRCMFNNYGFEKFWRMWHKGFNHWLIRYLYIPLGGNKNIISILMVILFVAFWHDHTIKILLWALILVLFMIPQIAIKMFFRKHYKHLYIHQWFKYICALVSSLYIQIICCCNLIGFGYGFDSAKIVLNHIYNQPLNFVYMTIALALTAILMFYIRETQRPRRND